MMYRRVLKRKRRWEGEREDWEQRGGVVRGKGGSKEQWLSRRDIMRSGSNDLVKGKGGSEDWGRGCMREELGTPEGRA